MMHKNNRRQFCKNAAIASSILAINPLISCNTKSNSQAVKKKIPLKLSLAQWSLNKAFFAKELDPIEFAPITASYGIKAVEYVNQFYLDQANNDVFWMEMQQRAQGEGVESLLIMVDDEGDLGDKDAAKRKEAAINHQKWVNAARILGCHSIRVNAFGEGTRDELHDQLVDGLGQLCEYAAKEEINILIENHGLFSSNGKWVTALIDEVNSPYLGTLPDFGNWCLNEKWGSTMNNECTESYDIYQGVKDFLPYAKGVSAKSYNFNNEGRNTFINYEMMLRIVHDFGYDGYIGIEYEGDVLSEPEGIKATKALIEKEWSKLNG